MSTYFDSDEEVFKPIPEAPYYALSNDSFMSGWGFAKDKINTCVVPCQSWEELRGMIEYMESRSDQKYIRYSVNKPRAKAHVLYSLVGWVETATNKGFIKS